MIDPVATFKTANADGIISPEEAQKLQRQIRRVKFLANDVGRTDSASGAKAKQKLTAELGKSDGVADALNTANQELIEDATAQIKGQAELDRTSRLIAAVSNALKRMHETMMGVIQNMR